MGPRRKYCNDKCKNSFHSARRKPPRQRQAYLYSCEYCYTQFASLRKKTSPSEPRFCNGSCAQRYRYETPAPKRKELKPFVVDPTKHLGLVGIIAHQHRGPYQQNQPVEDLEQYGDGIEGLLHACREFDPSKGLKFSTYASQCIRGLILKNLRDRRKYSVKATENRNLDHVSSDSILPKDCGQVLTSGGR